MVPNTTDPVRVIDDLYGETIYLLHEADLIEEDAAQEQRWITEGFRLTDDGRYQYVPEPDEYEYDNGPDDNASDKWTESEVAFANSYGEWQRDRYLDQQEAKDLAESARDREAVVRRLSPAW